MTPGKRELPSTARVRQTLLTPRRIIIVEGGHHGQQESVRKPEEPFRPGRHPQRGGRPGLHAGAEARPGAACCHRLLQRHLLRPGRRAACHAQDARGPGDRQRLPGQAGGLQPRAGHDEGHAGGLAAGPVEARSGPVPQGLRPRRGQRPHPAHAGAVRPLRPVRPQGPVVLAPAGRPAVAERGFRGEAAVGFDRQRSEPARRAAPGAADPAGQRPPGAVRLADRQAGREVGTGHRGRPAGGGSGIGCLPQGGDG